MATWEKVQAALEQATAMHFDGCHKIYLSMDSEQEREFDGYQTEVPDLDTLKRWFDDSSCGLRFVTACRTKGEETEFDSLIAQFEEVS